MPFNCARRISKLLTIALQATFIIIADISDIILHTLKIYHVLDISAFLFLQEPEPPWCAYLIVWTLCVSFLQYSCNMELNYAYFLMISKTVFKCDFPEYIFHKLEKILCYHRKLHKF